ncbi:MAG: DNA-directed RNA polymerase subunit omega, partial [Clostridiales Family XIII bacterium]|nr:DNA-directed RNA polymerase subunit omega [Clostridiales Family XIII bacterium]
MLYPPINRITERTDSRYTLVILAAKRSRDLIEGKAPLELEGVSKPDSKKPVSQATYE